MLANDNTLMVIHIDRNGMITDVNHIWLKKMGYAHHECIGLPLESFLSNEECHNLETNIAHIDTYGFVSNHFLHLLPEDGTRMDVVFQGNAIYDEEGTYTKINCEFLTLLDVMHSSSITKSLLEEERFLKNLLYIKSHITQMMHHIKDRNLFLSAIIMILDEPDGIKSAGFYELYNEKCQHCDIEVRQLLDQKILSYETKVYTYDDKSSNQIQRFCVDEKLEGIMTFTINDTESKEQSLILYTDLTHPSSTEVP